MIINIYYFTISSNCMKSIYVYNVCILGQTKDLCHTLTLNTICFMTIWYVKLAGSSYSHCITGQETIYSIHPHLAFGCVTVHFTFI